MVQRCCCCQFWIFSFQFRLSIFWYSFFSFFLLFFFYFFFFASLVSFNLSFVMRWIFRSPEFPLYNPLHVVCRLSIVSFESNCIVCINYVCSCECVCVNIGKDKKKYKENQIKINKKKEKHTTREPNDNYICVLLQLKCSPGIESPWL